MTTQTPSHCSVFEEVPVQLTQSLTGQEKNITDFQFVCFFHIFPCYGKEQHSPIAAGVRSITSRLKWGYWYFNQSQFQVENKLQGFSTVKMLLLSITAGKWPLPMALMMHVHLFLDSCWGTPNCHNSNSKNQNKAIIRKAKWQQMQSSITATSAADRKDEH